MDGSRGIEAHLRPDARLMAEAARTEVPRLLWLWAAVGVAASAAILFYVHNSGYGYDALEYLVIARSLGEGTPFYHFVPSKSWGLYYLISAYFLLPQASTHLGVSVLIAAILLAIAVATFDLVRALGHSARAAAGAAILITVLGIFSELNYVQPTGLVFLCGVLAVRAVIGSDGGRWWRWLVAGLWLGAGMAFKSVAGVYLVAFVAWQAWRAVTQPAGQRVEHAMRGVWVVIGFLFAIGAQAAYFWSTDRLAPFIEWSFVFPLLHYPPHTEWLSKLYTKLLWVWIIVGLAAVWSVTPMIRRRLTADSGLGLLLACGVCGLVPVLKNQSSHYTFTGAAFLLIYAAIVADWVAAASPARSRRFWTTAGGVALALCLVSGALYQPGALARLWRLRSFPEEVTLAQTVRQHVQPDEYAIFLGQGSRAYWPTERYPNWPLINTDVQSTYYVERHAADLLKALDDPRLTLVEFNPEAPVFDDRHFLESPSSVEFVRQFSCRVMTQFVRRDDLLPPLVIWTRRDDQRPEHGRACEPPPSASREPQRSESSVQAGR